MVLEVLRESLAGVQTCLQLGVRDVARHDDRSLEVHAGADRVLGELGAHGVYSLVQVYLNSLRALARTTVLFRNQL